MYLRFIKNQAFSPKYDLAPPSPPSSLSRQQPRPERQRKRDNFMTGERAKGWGRSQIIQRRENMVLYINHTILSATRIQLNPSAIKKGRGWVVSFMCNNFCYMILKKNIMFLGFILTVERLMGSLHVCHSWK